MVLASDTSAASRPAITRERVDRIHIRHDLRNREPQRKGIPPWRPLTSPLGLRSGFLVSGTWVYRMPGARRFPRSSSAALSPSNRSVLS